MDAETLVSIAIWLLWLLCLAVCFLKLKEQIIELTKLVGFENLGQGAQRAFLFLQNSESATAK